MIVALAVLGLGLAVTRKAQRPIGARPSAELVKRLAATREAVIGRRLHLVRPPLEAPRHAEPNGHRDVKPDTTPARDAVGRLELPVTATVETGAKEQIDNLPNGLTLLGYGLGVWWCVGGPAWSALASIALDEVDGRVARATDQTTSFGADLDFTSDVVLSGMALQRVGAPAWTIPVSTLGSLAFRRRFGRPPVGSLRAAIMLYGVVAKK